MGEDFEFIPHGMRCEADDGRGSDFGRCWDPATGVVTHEGRERYVCAFHKTHYHPENENDGETKISPDPAGEAGGRYCVHGRTPLGDWCRQCNPLRR